MMGLTEREQRAYDFIARRLNETAVAPTLSEIAGVLGLGSKSTAHAAVSALVERGYLRKLPNRRQALELIDQTGRIQYFRFDDDTKELVEWPDDRRGAVQPRNRREGGRA